jgi:uncharacterized protein
VGHDFKDIFGDWDPKEELKGPGEAAPTGEPENRGPRTLNEKEMTVVGVFEHAETGGTAGAQTFVLLQDSRSRKVPIWIGRFEAFAISMAVEGEEFDRPMTHDLLKVILDRLGGEVERIVIDDLWQDTFYAKLTISRKGETHEIDCRPSDAVALALRTKAPIFMAESVIESVEQKF